MQKEWIFEPRVEHYTDLHGTGDHQPTNRLIATLIAEGEEAIALIMDGCEDSVKRMEYYKRAKKVPVSSKEQNLRVGISLRRCPVCLQITAAIEKLVTVADGFYSSTCAECSNRTELTISDCVLMRRNSERGTTSSFKPSFCRVLFGDNRGKGSLSDSRRN